MHSKKLIFIFIFLLLNNLYSAEIVTQSNSRVVYNDFTFTDDYLQGLLDWSLSLTNY